MLEASFKGLGHSATWPFDLRHLPIDLPDLPWIEFRLTIVIEKSVDLLLDIV